MTFNKVLSGLFLIVFLAVGGVMSLTTMWDIRDAAAETKPQTVIQGQWAALYEDLYNKNLHSFDLSKNLWGVINYTTFGEGTDGVVVADNGWLFTSEEFETQPRAKDNYQRNVDYIKTVSKELDRQNIALVIIPVPAKSRVYQDKLGAFPYPRSKRVIYNQFLNDMAQNGITTVRTYDTMQDYKEQAQTQDSLFLKTDTHWTPYGARIAAHATAQAVSKSFPGTITSPATYKSAVAASEPFEGDLTRYIPVKMFASYVQTPHEDITLYKTVAVQSGGADTDVTEEPDLSAALFSDTTPDVTLVGTSYSANPKWNFEGFLKEALQTDILNAADEGMGPFETMKEYLQDDAYKNSPPALVLWEIPERFLTFKYDLEATTDEEAGA